MLLTFSFAGTCVRRAWQDGGKSAAENMTCEHSRRRPTQTHGRAVRYEQTLAFDERVIEFMFDAFLPRSHAFVRRILPNRWDFAAFPLILGAAALMASGFQQAMAPLSELEAQAVSLNPACLPEYALRTTLRMLAAMALSLLFTFIYSALAAKNRRAEKVLVPLLDIAQSVPVLGYLSFTVTFFIA